jgi:polar amino acid transport system substrate-binding protein
MKSRTRKRICRSAIFLALALAAGLPCSAGQVPAPPASSPDVFVPSFWDPKAPLEKPDLGSLQNLRFVTEDDYPPFGFTLPDGSLVGFDVDLARAICDELKLSCTVQVRRFDTIVPALKAGTADAAVASMAITDQALQNVDFTSPYYRTPARFVARVESKLGAILPETIVGKRVGVQSGTAHEAYLKTFFPAATVQSYGSAAEVRAALTSGAVDLAFGDGVALAGWLAGPEASACCGFVGGPFTETRYFGEGAGIAVRKGNIVLRKALDYALAQLAAKGVYSDLYLKYFPIGIY